MALPGVPSPDIREKMGKFYQICMKYEPVNSKSSVSWRIYVFDDKDKVDNILKELTAARLQSQNTFQIGRSGIGNFLFSNPPERRQFLDN
jgi:hypothetical protein